MSYDWAILSTMARPADGILAASSGCYEAARAAALSGVPRSTVYYWARKGIVVPSISPVQEKLWSYADLMALRMVSWLRRPKVNEGVDLPASPMSRVRHALSMLPHYGIDLWSDEPSLKGSRLLVDQRGEIFIRTDKGIFAAASGDQALPHEESFGLTGPFELDGHRGPDLIRPRSHLRIVPEKVAGQPHISGTRLTTATLAALSERGYSESQIAEMYRIPKLMVDEAIDLESELRELAA